MTLIQRLVPTNMEAEKKKFFFDPNYNPQFLYSEKITSEELQKYVRLSDEYLEIAEKIIESAEKNSDPNVKTDDKHVFLPKEEVEKKIIDFLEREGIKKVMSIRFTSKALARTSVHQNTLILHLPVEFTETALNAMLYHEIGTHQLRSMNDRQQVWRGKTDEMKLRPYYVTEEGLAVLHSLIPRENKLLLSPALKYKAVHYAQTHSFSETYAMLQKHVSDRNKRFDICMRVKRGMKDTSQAGAFSKDQVYLKGAIEVWHWLKNHAFDPTSLYIGKVALEDVENLASLSVVHPLLLPYFYVDSPQEYKKVLQQIGKANFFA